MAVPVRRASSTVLHNASGTNAPVNYPTLAANDVLIAHVVAPSSAVHTPPPTEGWTLVDSRAQGTALRHSVWWKIADGTETGTSAFALATAATSSTQMHSFSGGLTRAPIVSSLASGAAGTSGTTLALAAFRVVPANTLLMTFGASASTGLWTPPTGYTEVTDASATGRSINVNQKTTPVAVNLSSGGATLTNATNNAAKVGISLGIRESVVETGPQFRSFKSIGFQSATATYGPVDPATHGKIEAGDLLLAHISTNANSTVNTVPAGWNLVNVNARQNSGTTLTEIVYYRICDGTELNANGTANTFTWVLAAAAVGQISIYHIKDNDPSAPIDAFNFRVNTVAGLTMAMPIVTTNGTNRLLLCMTSAVNFNSTLTEPAGWVEWLETASGTSPNGVDHDVEAQTLAAQGSNAAANVSNNTSALMIAMMVAVAPPSPVTDLPSAAQVDKITTIDAAPVVQLRSQATVAKTSTITPAPRLDRRSSATVAKTTTVVAQPVLEKRSAATLSRSSTITPAPVLDKASGASLARSSTLTPLPVLVKTSASTLARVSGIAAVPQLDRRSQATLARASTITPVSYLERRSSVTVARASTVTAAPALERRSAVTLSRTAAVAVAPIVHKLSQATVGRVSTIAAVPALTKRSQATLARASTIIPAPVLGKTSQATLARASTIAVAPVLQKLSQAALAKASGITPAPVLQKHSQVALAKTSAISPAPALEKASQVTVVRSSTVIPAPILGKASQVTVARRSTIVPAPILGKTSQVTVARVASVSAAPIREVRSQASVGKASTIAAAPLREAIGQATLARTSSISVVPATLKLASAALNRSMAISLIPRLEKRSQANLARLTQIFVAIAPPTVKASAANLHISQSIAVGPTHLSKTSSAVVARTTSIAPLPVRDVYSAATLSRLTQIFVAIAPPTVKASAATLSASRSIGVGPAHLLKRSIAVLARSASISAASLRDVYSAATLARTSTIHVALGPPQIHASAATLSMSRTIDVGQAYLVLVSSAQLSRAVSIAPVSFRDVRSRATLARSMQILVTVVPPTDKASAAEVIRSSNIDVGPVYLAKVGAAQLSRSTTIAAVPFKELFASATLARSTRITIVLAPYQRPGVPQGGVHVRDRIGGRASSAGRGRVRGGVRVEEPAQGGVGEQGNASGSVRVKYPIEGGV